MTGTDLIFIQRIEKSIYLISGEKVMLDRDLAGLYGVETKVLNRAAKETYSDSRQISCFKLLKMKRIF